MRVGIRVPARVTELVSTGCQLELDLGTIAPGRSPYLDADLLFEQTLAPERARSLRVGQRTEVVIIGASEIYRYSVTSLPADPAWLTWNGGTARQLAQRIRATGENDLLPILADALEEAGCPEAALLERCRRPEDDDLRWFVTLLATQE
jgi:hypothetical protein